MPARLYFDAADGISYRVHDVRFADGKTKRLPLGDQSANYRVFLAQDGVQRLHKFNRGDDHGIREDLLERQLRSAGYAQTEKAFDPRTLDSERKPST